MIVLQKDLKLYRFKNQNPSKEENQKFDYQLFRNKRIVANQLSNNEFFMGKVEIRENNTSMDLITGPKNLDFRELESPDLFIVTIKVAN